MSIDMIFFRLIFVFFDLVNRHALGDKLACSICGNGDHGEAPVVELLELAGPC